MLLRLFFLLVAGYLLNAQARLDSCCNANNLQNITAPKNESDRSVFQLGHMIRCQSGCDPLSYKRYGCFCGFKGAGRPVDSIDRCCLNHDWCYTRLGCPPFALYVLRYRWLCRKPGHAQCLRNQYANAAMNYCALRLCECDRTFASCVARSACPQRKAICWANPLIAFTNLIASF